MQLDKRIINGKRPLTCFDTEQAKQYVDTMGYFTDDISDFNNLDDCYYDTLNRVDDNSSRPFFNKYLSKYFTFFLPEKFIKQRQAKKEYRPYTIEEFCNEGFEVVVFRLKNDESLEYHVRYNGYLKYDNDVYLIIFGNKLFPLNDLFEIYEYLDDDGEWKPFGVEE